MKKMYKIRQGDLHHIKTKMKIWRELFEKCSIKIYNVKYIWYKKDLIQPGCHTP